jgi:hypothetical protein
LENSNLSCKVRISIIMIHEFEYFSKLLVPINFLSFETQVKSKFPEASSAECEWFPVSLFEL